MNIYLFFVIFGFIFVCMFAIFTNFIYDLFPINRLTSLLKPLGKGVWNKVNGVVFPILLWSIFEIFMLGNNNMFLIATVLFILVDCSFMYIVKYACLLFDEENDIINVIAIIIGTAMGIFIAYLVLLNGKLGAENVYVSLIGVSSLTLIYLVMAIGSVKTHLIKKPKKENQDV